MACCPGGIVSIAASKTFRDKEDGCVKVVLHP
jgi:hypothetical protein